MELTAQLDLDDSLAEDNVLAGVGLSHPDSSGETEEWFPYPSKTIGVL